MSQARLRARPRVAEKLCPKGYPYGAKRAAIDTDCYETFNRDHVPLVDISDGGITRITPRVSRRHQC